MKKSSEPVLAVDYYQLQDIRLVEGIAYTYVVNLVEFDPISQKATKCLQSWLSVTKEYAVQLQQDIMAMLAKKGHVTIKTGQNIKVAYAKVDIATALNPENVGVALREKLKKGGWSQHAADSILLDSLSNKPRGYLTEAQENAIMERIRGGDHLFISALSRGMENGRKPTFNSLDECILSGWDEVELYGHSVAGLKHWGPEAAAPFLSLLLGLDIFAPNYRQTVKRLGLKKLKLQIRTFSFRSKLEEIILNKGSKDEKRYQKIP